MALPVGRRVRSEHVHRRRARGRRPGSAGGTPVTSSPRSPASGNRKLRPGARPPPAGTVHSRSSEQCYLSCQRSRVAAVSLRATLAQSADRSEVAVDSAPRAQPSPDRRSRRARSRLRAGPTSSAASVACSACSTIGANPARRRRTASVRSSGTAMRSAHRLVDHEGIGGVDHDELTVRARRRCAMLPWSPWCRAARPTGSCRTVVRQGPAIRRIRVLAWNATCVLVERDARRDPAARPQPRLHVRHADQASSSMMLPAAPTQATASAGSKRTGTTGRVAGTLRVMRDAPARTEASRRRRTAKSGPTEIAMAAVPARPGRRRRTAQQRHARSRARSVARAALVRGAPERRRAPPALLECRSTELGSGTSRPRPEHHDRGAGHRSWPIAGASHACDVGSGRARAPRRSHLVTSGMASGPMPSRIPSARASAAKASPRDDRTVSASGMPVRTCRRILHREHRAVARPRHGPLIRLAVRGQKAIRPAPSHDALAASARAVRGGMQSSTPRGGIRGDDDVPLGATRRT